jgi:hypothetical protein
MMTFSGHVACPLLIIGGKRPIKGIVQRILSGVDTMLQIIRAGKLEARPFFFLNFKGTPSQEEQKTISAA